VHEPPEGYGQEPYPNQGQGSGGYPPQQPPYQGQQQYPGQQQPYPGQQQPYEQPGQQQQPPYEQPGQQQNLGYAETAAYIPQQPQQQQPPQSQPQWGQPGVGGYGPPPQDPGFGGWGPPPGPPKKNNGPVVAVAVVAALVLLGGGGAIAWALSSGDSDRHTPVAVTTPSTTTLPTTPPSFPTTAPSFPSAFPSPTFPTPSSSPTLDESMFVQAGDCVKISGRAPHLKMFKTDCDSAQYKVLKRFSGTSDRSKCRSVPGYTTAFYATSKKYTFLSYVICLKHV
jgi:hypothetical protein